MKNKLLIIILFTATTFVSCESGSNGDIIPIGNRTIQTIQYENCEYVYLRRYGSISITHKGNCKFCIETKNK
jgi:hypothetical protein